MAVARHMFSLRRRGLALFPLAATVAAVVLAGLALLLALALCPPATAAATTVHGSEYAIGFTGMGKAEAALEAGSQESGSWTIEDVPVDLWLPASAESVTEGASDSSSTQSPHDGWNLEDNEDPASLSYVYEDESSHQEVECSASWLSDQGDAILSAGVTLGSLVVATSYSSDLARSFSTESPSGKVPYWTCEPGSYSGESFAGFIGYPPSGHATEASGGSIGYAATVPLADVGQPSFTLPVSDESTVNTAPWWTAEEALSHHFEVSGTYSFTKLCDGTIAYVEGVVEGTCGGGPIAPAPPSPVPPSPRVAKQCLVPHLKGKKLGEARKLLGAAGCKLGKVKRRKAGRPHRGKVLAQSKPPGRRLGAGAAVGVVVGR